MKTKLASQEQFFFDNAGYSYDPKKETAKQGKVRGAKLLAQAETIAKGEDWYFEWRDDWDVGSHKEFYGKGSCYEDSEPNTCETCTLFDADGKVLASLGCTDDATHDYRRVIEAELACEGVERFREEGARVNV